MCLGEMMLCDKTVKTWGTVEAGGDDAKNPTKQKKKQV